jgi:hypothetical protein
VAAAAHVRRVRADLAVALGRLDAPQRAAISAHAQGGAARAAGLPRSTYYRALGHAQALLQSDLRGRLAGYGVLGGLVQRAREIFAHAEAVHAAAAAVVVAIGAAVVVTVHDEAAHHFAPPAPAVRAVGGRVQPPQAPRTAALRAPRRRVAVGAPNRPAIASRHAPAAAPTSARAACPYDPSSYDC